MGDVDVEQIKREIKAELTADFKANQASFEAKLLKQYAGDKNRMKQEFQELVTRMTGQMADITGDGFLAVLYTMNYQNRFNVELHARGHMLRQAIDEFNKFMGLPARSSNWSNWSAIWDAAWGMLSMAVPALKLTKVLDAWEKNAGLAVAIAAASESQVPTAAKAIMLTTVRDMSS
jgi:hypothetical protein